MGVDSFPEQVLGDRIGEVSGLQGGCSKSLDGAGISSPKRQASVREIVLLAKLHNNGRDLPQLASGHSRKQMVLQLKLQSTKEPVHPRGAINVQSPAGLLLEPVVAGGLPDVHIGGEMVEAELDVLERSHSEASKNKHDPLRPIGEVRDQKRKPSPENKNPHDVQCSIRDFSSGEQEKQSLHEEIHSGHTHHRVECEMLVTNEESSQGIEIQLPTIEMGCQRAEESSRNSKNRDVLKIRVMVQAITRDMVGIVSPFPPSDADSSQAITREKLSQFVEPTARHYIRMPRIMPHISALDPQHTQKHSGTQMDQNALTFHNPIHHKAHHYSNRNQRIHSHMPFLLEQTLLGEFRRQSPVVLGNLRHLEILKVESGEEAVEVRPGGAGMVRDERIGDVVAGQIEERLVAAGVLRGPIGDIVHLALDRDPQISGFVVLPKLCRRNVLLLGLHIRIRSRPFKIAAMGGGGNESNQEKTSFKREIWALWGCVCGGKCNPPGLERGKIWIRCFQNRDFGEPLLL